MSGSPWQALGIARTADETAIRRAYAARLKAIDVDQDPAAFIALREALRAAQGQAQAMRAQAQRMVMADDGAPNAEADPAQPEPGPDPEPGLEPVPEPAPVVQQRPGWIDDIEAVQMLIFGERSREEIFAEVGQRAERILNGHEMDEIDHAARVEQWAAQTILQGVPRSNGLLVPAIQRFDWLARTRHWDCPQAIHAVVARYADCQFLNALRDGQGPHALAFRRIYRGMKPSSAYLPGVEQFLAVLHTQHPSLLQELPPESLEIWQRAIEKRHKRPIARVRRARNAGWEKFVRFAKRYKLDAIGAVLLGILVGILLIGFAIATHGGALIFIIPALIRIFSSRK